MLSTSLQSKIPDTVRAFCVGSLPFKNAGDAVAFVRNNPWILPFWPELPQKDSAEFMVPRSDRALQSAWHGYTANEAAGFFATIKQFENEKISVPVIKGQLLGPLSHAFFSEELEGDFSAKLRAATKACLRQMEWQIAALSKISAAVLLVLDEPGFIYWEKLSAQEKELAKEQLTYLYVSAGERNCFLGFHCCAPLVADFLSLPADLYSIDALNDASLHLLSTRAALFTSSGQPLLALGVVPAATSEDFDRDMAKGHTLYANIKASLPKGLRTLFSANCGHGLASETWINYIYSHAQNAS